MTSIYLPAYVSYDGYHRMETLTDDYGYFATEEAAKAWAAAQNEDREGYARYVAQQERHQADYDSAYQKAVDKWNRLVETFDDPESFMKEPKRTKAVVLTYEKWAEGREDRLGYVEIELHTETAS